MKKLIVYTNNAENLHYWYALLPTILKGPFNSLLLYHIPYLLELCCEGFSCLEKTMEVLVHEKAAIEAELPQYQKSNLKSNHEVNDLSEYHNQLSAYFTPLIKELASRAKEKCKKIDNYSKLFCAMIKKISQRRFVMNIGILGAGRIAITMADTVNNMKDVNLYAVASRNLERAEAFAKEYKVEKAYGSYEEMVKDEQVDLVYIATPHSYHLEHIKLAADHGKAILCEKAFTMDSKEAKEAYAYAKEKNVLLAEAMWVRYMPMTKTLQELIRTKRIGDVVGLTANLGYSIMRKERILKPELGGGAILDLGVYTLNFATTVLGDDVKAVDSTVVMHDTGVDRQEFVDLTYEDGAVAGLYNTAQTITDRKGVIYGTKGYIVVDNINNYEAFHIYNQKYELEETINRPEQITGFEYQVNACKRALEEGKLECEEMPHAHSIKIMELIDVIRSKWV